MTAVINQNLNKNTIDFLIMQVIAECKLNRLERSNNSAEPFVQFYHNYVTNGYSFKNPDNTPNIDLINQFKVAVGAAPTLAEAAKMSADPNYVPIVSETNEHDGYEGGAGSFTKITSSQVDYFINNYKILDYHGNDSTGFSATVFQNIHNNEKTISFRSTEYAEDFYKDAVGADQEISENGTAFAQSIALVKYIEELKSKNTLTLGNSVNITGFSLGGNLAATFNRMYSSEFNINKFLAFNAPGAGHLKASSPGIDPYIEFKDELKEYNIMVNTVRSLGIDIYQNNLPNSLSNYLSILNTSNEYQDLNDYQKTSVTSFLSYYYYNKDEDLYKIIAALGDSTNISSEVENEMNKKSATTLNANTSYNDNLIYNNEFYKVYKGYLVDKYYAHKANVDEDGNLLLSNGILDQAENLPDIRSGMKSGYKIPNFYEGNTTWISGIATTNVGSTSLSDFNFVANSNYYSNPLDIVIEDRIEVLGGLGRLPNLPKATNFDFLAGNFGNTHSISLLNKSLSLMTFLSNIEGTSDINVQKYSGIISSTTMEVATQHIVDNDLSSVNSIKDLNIGDNNSIAVVVNTLYKAIVDSEQKSPDIIFENTISGWANIHKIDLLQRRQQSIIDSLNGSSVNIESFYKFKSTDLDISSVDLPNYEFKSVEEIYTLAMQSNNEGMAYRYAIENLNTFVIKGLDYQTINFNSKNINNQTPNWYKSRIDILMGIIKSNVQNHGDYISNYNISVDDKNQGLKFHTVNQKTKLNSNVNYMNEWELNSNEPTSTIRNPNNPNGISYYQHITSKFHYMSAYLEKKYGSTGTLFQNLFDYVNVKALNPTQNMANSIKEYINSNIYYLNPLAASFISGRKNDNEKIFIQPNEAGMYAIKDQNVYKYDKVGTGPIAANINPYMHGNGKITSIVDLKEGDDYIEVKSSYAQIFGSGGKKDYNLSSIHTIISDAKKTGTITLDGILLNGGKYTSDKKKKVQTETINGEVINITYAVVSGHIVITNEKTQHQVIIKNTSGLDDKMFGFKSTKNIPFKEKWYKSITNVFTTNALRTSDSMSTTEEPPLPENTIAEMDMTKFFNDTQEFTDLNVTLANTYNSQTEFNAALLVNANITASSVNYRDGTDLIIYDKNNPSEINVIKDMFNPDGTLKQYQANIHSGNYDNNGNPIYWNNSGTIQINGLTNVGYGYYNLQQYDYIISVNNAITSGTETVIDYKGNTKLAINDTAFQNIAVSQEGNNLVFSNLDLDNPGKLIINNYFTFDHSNNTNIFTGYNEYSPEQSILNQIPNNNLYSLLSLNFTNDNDIFVATESSVSITLNGGAGDDVIGGSSKDEVFVSSGIRNNTGLVSWDGDDLLNGGGGADTFVFSENSGYDTITDFGNDDKIFIKSDNILNGSQFKYNIERDNNDLILQIGEQTGGMYNNTSIAVTAQIRILNYFATVDYQNDTRIYYFPQGMTGASNSALPPTLVFNQQDFSKINDIVVSGGTLNQNDTHAKNLTANDEDNTITITKNDTVVLEHSLDSIYGTYMPNDGNDTFVIDISEPEPDQLVRNQFRTEIGFSLYGGQDVINGGEFKKENEYGDIVRIKDLEASEIVFNTIEVNGNIESISATLSDGSTMVVKVAADTPLDAAIFKLDDQILTLESIYGLIETTFITADNNDNQTFNISTSYRDSYIQTFDGEDIIHGGNADDYIFTGKGDDKVFLSSGKDTYIFLEGDGIDRFVFKPERELFDATLVVDVNFNPEDIKYYFNSDQNKIYLAFNAYEGIVFENSDWTDILYLRQSLKIEDLDGNPITISNEINDITSSPFIAKPIETVSGTTRMLKGNEASEVLVATPQHNNIILGNDGNDTIIGNNVSSMRSIIFGGKGDDNISADYIDIVTVKDGDGHDTINANYQYYLLNILHNETITDEYGDKLFNLSVNNNDLNIIYNDSRESVTLANFFNTDGSIVGNIGVSIYNKDKDQMSVYYLPDLLNQLGLNKDILSNSEFSINNDVTSYWTSPESSGYILGGEISYQYLLTGDYNLTNNTNNVMNQINNNNTFLPKV